MRTRGIVSRPQNISTVAQLSIGGLVSINARTSLPCAAAKRSHSGNRTAICIPTSYAFRHNNCCSIIVLRCRPRKLIPACRTPQVSLPNMASNFLPRKTRRQDIISSIFHNRFKDRSPPNPAVDKQALILPSINRRFAIEFQAVRSCRSSAMPL